MTAPSILAATGRPYRRPPVAAPWMLLASLLALRTVLLFSGDGLSYALLHSSRTDHAWGRALLSSNAWVVAVDVATLAALTWALRREGRKLSSLLGPVRVRRDVVVGVALAVLLAVGLLVATFLGNLLAYGGAPPSGPLLRVPLWLAWWSVLVMPATVAVAEELLYRGYLLPRLQARIGWWPAAVVVSLAFGLQHAAFSATSGQAVLARVVATTLLGLLLAVLARRLRRLLPLVIGHWLLDVVGLGLPLLLLAVRAG